MTTRTKQAIGSGTAAAIGIGALFWMAPSRVSECPDAGMVFHQAACERPAGCHKVCDVTEDCDWCDLEDVWLFQAAFGDPSTGTRIDPGPSSEWALGDFTGKDGVNLQDWFYFHQFWGR